MLKRDGIIYRNLEEQVEENKKNIAHILEINNLLVGAGVKLIGHGEAEADLPNPQTYAGNYGDAYMVGTETPYNLYVFTRPLVGEQYPDWFNVGPFPAPSTVPGPQGVQGPQGEPGVDGATWTTGTTNPAVGNAKEGDLYLKSDGTVFKFTSGAWTRFTFLSGPQGPQGEQGPQGIPGPQGPQGAQGNIGDPGDTVKIVGTVASEDLLPTPTEEDRHNAYIIHNDTDNHDHLYIVIGDTDLSWQDTGAVGTELDINSFVTTNTNQEITGLKDFKSGLNKNGIDVATTTDVTNSTDTCKAYTDEQFSIYNENNLLIINDKANTTINGITYSIENGVIKLNGKATASVDDVIGTITLTAQDYYIWDFNSSSTNAYVYIDDSRRGYPRNRTYTAVAGTYNIKLWIPLNDNTSNITLKPMIIKGNLRPKYFKKGTSHLYLHKITYNESGTEDIVVIMRFITNSSTEITHLGQLGNDIYKMISISGFRGGSTVYNLDPENETFDSIGRPQYLYSKTLIVDDEVTTL